MMHARLMAAGVTLLGLVVPPAFAQAPDARPSMPRVLYGTPVPDVIYGPSSAPPAPPREPGPAVQPPRQAIPAAPPRYQPSTGYVWLPHGLAPPYWDRPRLRPPPEVSVPAARGGMFDSAQPLGRYVGRPPAISPPPRSWGREGGRRD